MDIGFEHVPEDYVGDYPYITIHRKPSQQKLASDMASVIDEALAKWQKFNTRQETKTSKSKRRFIFIV